MSEKKPSQRQASESSPPSSEERRAPGPAAASAEKSAPSGSRPGHRRFTSLKRVTAIFEQVLENSPADETELVWFERRHGSAVTGEPVQVHEPRLTVLIRVVEGGRLGWHRTEVADPALLANAIRHSMAVATVQPQAPRRPVLSTDEKPARTDLPLRDEALEKLTARGAAQLHREWCGEEVKGRFHWSRTRLVVFNSHGVRRHAMTTEASFTACAGEPGRAGYAAASARRLADLDPQAVAQRARSRRAEGQAAPPPAQGVPVVLSAEAMIELLDLVNAFAFAGRAYLDGSSFLALHRNVQVFDRAVHVRDDGGRLPGMPFPFDLEGSLKRPVDLIVEGRPSTPALSRSQSGKAGLEPTGQSVGGDDALFGNLFLLPGGIDDDELLQRADGGLWIGWLERPECYEPGRLEIRTVARGVRRIENGALGAPVPDLVWETSLLAALARLAGIGRHAIIRAMPSTPLGGISAPAVALADASGFSTLT